MNEYKEQIHSYIQVHRHEIINELKELVKIPSVRGEAEPNAPFGKACADVLAHMERLYQKNGFETELDSEGGYLLSYFGEGEQSLGLFAHADVVPVSDDWTLTSPFEPLEKDGFLVGRGVMDDKSAVIISLYCVKMLKELNIPFHSRLICFTGGNEESGMQDIKNYVSAHTPPDFALVCDTGYPPYRGNKGMLQFTAGMDVAFDCITDMTGSNAKGAILGKAKVKLDVQGGEIIIETTGIAKHTALPEGSLNAGYLAAEMLSKCEFISEYDRRQMQFISRLLSHYYGEAVGIENDDPEFGKLTFANDVIRLEDGRAVLHFNLRFGAAVDIGLLKERIQKVFKENGWSVEFHMERTGKALDIHNSWLQVCMDVYKKFCGDEQAISPINAGGTYAVYLPCAIEIGPTLEWGTPDGMKAGHGGVHQPDECINIDGMLKAIELTMLMLLACDKGEG